MTAAELLADLMDRRFLLEAREDGAIAVEPGSQLTTHRMEALREKRRQRSLGGRIQPEKETGCAMDNM